MTLINEVDLEVVSVDRYAKYLHCMCLKNHTALAYYNFDLHQRIVINSRRNVAKNVRSQMILYFATSHNYSASALPGKTRKHENRIFSLK